MLYTLVLLDFLYVAGGYYAGSALSSCSRYDPRMDEWSEINNMLEKRQYLALLTRNGMRSGEIIWPQSC